jgi:HSP20 family molecular chaperone IbpA
MGRAKDGDTYRFVLEQVRYFLQRFSHNTKGNFRITFYVEPNLGHYPFLDIEDSKNKVYITVVLPSGDSESGWCVRDLLEEMFTRGRRFPEAIEHQMDNITTYRRGKITLTLKKGVIVNSSYQE